jgi:hypothetical protein
VEGAFNMESFNVFIKRLIDTKMNPYCPINHNKNSVLIMDNCRIHKDPAIIAYAGERCIILLTAFALDSISIEVSR